MTARLSQAATPYCGSAPLPADLLGRWNLDPVLLAAISFVAVLVWRQAPSGQAGRRPLVAGGVALALLLFVSPFCALTSALFSARVLHHILLTAALAPLIAFSLARRPHGAGSLALWTLLQAVVFWAWHAPNLYAAALSAEAVYWAMQISLLGSSIGFWRSLRASEPTSALGALLATTVQMGLLGAIITFAGRPLYAPHFETTWVWSLSPLADQQLAGLIMWVPAAGLYLGAGLWIAARWLKAEGRMVA